MFFPSIFKKYSCGGLCEKKKWIPWINNVGIFLIIIIKNINLSYFWVYIIMLSWDYQNNDTIRGR